MTTHFYINIGKIIQRIRKDRKMSQSELAEVLGKQSATYVNLIESGKRKVSLESLMHISKALKVPLNTFLDKDYKSLDSDALLELALISDFDLKSVDKKLVLDFVHFLRSRNNKS